jgi:hypothetical protein
MRNLLPAVVSSPKRQPPTSNHDWINGPAFFPLFLVVAQEIDPPKRATGLGQTGCKGTRVER